MVNQIFSMIILGSFCYNQDELIMPNPFIFTFNSVDAMARKSWAEISFSPKFLKIRFNAFLPSETIIHRADPNAKI